MAQHRRLLQGRRIDPRPITASDSVVELIENAFLAYNAARLREACQLFTRKMLAPDVTVGVSLTGALTPAGLGISALIPLIEHGFIDWIVSTGANLYHDTHFGIGLSLHQGDPHMNDVILRQEGIVRIYDIFFDYTVLLSTDAFFREIIASPEFQSEMSSAEFHYRCGKYIRERERVLGLGHKSLLGAAYEHGMPVYTSSPGDSSIGMNIAAMALQGNRLKIDVARDVNETAALVLGAKRSGGKSGVLILGGGSPKNFLLQTEPQIQEVLGIDEKGHDYFLQVTDARPDTGGLCVAEGTKIDMPRDLSQYPEGVPIESLVGQSGFYVYSYDHEQKKMVLAEAEKVWRTEIQEVWRLRYGWYTGMRKEKYREAAILATPDHLIMLSNGAYKPLKTLKLGVSIKAFNTSYSVHGYRQIGLGIGKTLPEHRHLLEFKLGRLLDADEVAHHIDGNHLNNDLTNLEVMHYRPHLSEHRKKDWQRKTDEERQQWREFHRQRMRDGIAQKISRQFWDNMTAQELAEYKEKKMVEIRHEIDEGKVREALMRSGGSVHRARKMLKVDWKTLNRRLTMYGITKEELKERYANNHKVISVEPTGIFVPVYDMKVKHTRNFVANGIVVHNSGATPGEAVSWGKIDPDRLPDAVVCYVDATIALPLLTAYALAQQAPRPLKRLYDRREALYAALKAEHERARTQQKSQT